MTPKALSRYPPPEPIHWVEAEKPEEALPPDEFSGPVGLTPVEVPTVVFEEDLNGTISVRREGVPLDE